MIGYASSMEQKYPVASRLDKTVEIDNAGFCHSDGVGQEVCLYKVGESMELRRCSQHHNWLFADED